MTVATWTDNLARPLQVTETLMWKQSNRSRVKRSCGPNVVMTHHLLLILFPCYSIACTPKSHLNQVAMMYGFPRVNGSNSGAQQAQNKRSNKDKAGSSFVEGLGPVALATRCRKDSLKFSPCPGRDKEGAHWHLRCKIGKIPRWKSLILLVIQILSPPTRQFQREQAKFHHTVVN